MDDIGTSLGPYEENDDEIDFICPITLQVMKRPVIAMDGKMYDWWAIDNALKKINKSPLTREKMPRIYLSPECLVKTYKQFCKKHNIPLLRDLSVGKLEQFPSLKSFNISNEEYITLLNSVQPSKDALNFLLCFACAEGSIDKVKILLSHGAEVEFADYRSVRLAVRERRIVVLEYLISQGLKLDTIDYLSWDVVAEYGKDSSEELLILLLENKMVDDHWSLLFYFIFECSARGLNIYLEKMNVPQEILNIALQYALSLASIVMIRILLKRGAQYGEELNQLREDPVEFFTTSDLSSETLMVLLFLFFKNKFIDSTKYWKKSIIKSVLDFVIKKNINYSTCMFHLFCQLQGFSPMEILASASKSITRQLIIFAHVTEGVIYRMLEKNMFDHDTLQTTCDLIVHKTVFSQRSESSRYMTIMELIRNVYNITPQSYDPEVTER